ncbi:DUF6879 family protein [Krasilnikovia sp. M28-CT-15]|uniref:DUF6879 family protein n=1 Tax=Krasilnikovia sp. M28-CT-15 TaxID=3373540 RepID=UPI00399D3DB5
MTEQELGGYLTGFRSSAFRFEVRDRYNSDVGRESFRRYLAGEPDDFAWHRSWMRMLRNDREQGKLWQRVRIVSVPLSDWSRYALHVARLSVQAGEDIRYLPRDQANRLGLAPYDAWILDDHTLIHLHFNHEDDTFVGAEVIEDREVLARHRDWRRLALDQAMSLDDFATTMT